MQPSSRVAVRVARSIYGRWHRLRAQDRERLDSLAQGVKRRALDLPGSDDPNAAGDLAAASEELAEAIAVSAESDPAVDAQEAAWLRSDLRRDLERLAAADIRASHGAATRPEAAPHPNAG
jgi:hypothetical protein